MAEQTVQDMQRRIQALNEALAALVRANNRLRCDIIQVNDRLARADEENKRLLQMLGLEPKRDDEAQDRTGCCLGCEQAGKRIKALEDVVREYRKWSATDGDETPWVDRVAWLESIDAEADEILAKPEERS